MITVNNKKPYKDSKCMALWKIQNCGTVKRSEVARGWEEGGMNRKRTKGFFRAVKIMVDTHHFTLVQSHRIYTKSEP